MSLMSFGRCLIHDVQHGVGTNQLIMPPPYLLVMATNCRRFLGHYRSPSLHRLVLFHQHLSVLREACKANEHMRSTHTRQALTPRHNAPAECRRRC